MKTTLKKRAPRLATALLTAAVCLTGFGAFSATPAAAIKRVPCSSVAYARVINGQDTCWAEKGGQSVKLVNVRRIWGGSNSGYVKVQGSSSTKYAFAARFYREMSGQTVSYIHIIATNG